jgi:hypothetical protein
MPPTNQTGMDMFDSELVLRTSQLIIEESLQDNLRVRVVSDSNIAHIFVQPTFVSYQRPDIKFSLGLFSIKTETVVLTMKIVFYEPQYKFYQQMECTTSLVKDIRSNFYSVLESQKDFADSLLFNLTKKGIDQCFNTYSSIIL